MAAWDKDLDPAAQRPAWERDLDPPVVAAPAAAAPADPQAAAIDAYKRNQRSSVGDLVAGAVRGAGSIGATLLAPVDAAARELGIQNDFIGRTDRREAMDGALRDLGADTGSVTYGAGKLGVEVGGTLGVGPALAGMGAAIPRIAAAVPNALAAVRTAGMGAGTATGVLGALLRAVGGAVTGGASAGLVNPSDAGAGAAVGAVAPGATKALGYVGTKVGDLLRPSVNNPDLARRAIETYGIPLGPANITDSRTVRAVRSVLNDAPVIGGIGERQGDAVQRGFNRAVGGTFGENAERLTPAVMDSARGRMGAEFERLWGGNTLNVDPKLTQDLQGILSKAKTTLMPGQAGQVEQLVKTLLDKANGGQIEGQFANNWQSELRLEADAQKGLHKKVLGDLRSAVLTAFGRGLPPGDAAALANNATQYRAFKVVEPLLSGAEAGVAGRESGNIPAGLLPQAVRQQYGPAVAQSPFAELSQIGSQYVADRVARTGGSTRAMVQNSLLGTSLAAGAITNPISAAFALPAAAGANAALGSAALGRRMVATGGGPGLLQRLLNDPNLSQLLYRSAPVAATGQ